MAKKNSTATETKVNRYTTLFAELKRISDDLKVKKKEVHAAIKKLEDEYREYRKTVYVPARDAAYKLFEESKLPKSEKKTEKKAKKVKKTKIVEDTTISAPESTDGCFVVDIDNTADE